MEIIISGFPPETTEDEIKEALESHGAPILEVKIMESNDVDRYTATVDVDTDETGCRVLAEKVNGTVWKGKKLRANYFLSRSS
ncbi:MAG TPA: RNA-binding protein [Gammaproteobacteria bacterium]|nr:RNA-binding protein [Gammaproteobacteria bacterium]